MSVTLDGQELTDYMLVYNDQKSSCVRSTADASLVTLAFAADNSMRNIAEIILDEDFPPQVVVNVLTATKINPEEVKRYVEIIKEERELQAKE